MGTHHAAAIIAALLALAGPGHTFGHEHGGAVGPPGALGKINFATSCSAQAQVAFETGVALLHSFEYERATRQFQEISATDVDCAISFWGSAMSLYHQLWNNPSDDDLASGWQLLEKAAAAAKKSPRESAWIHALSTLYQPGSRTVQQRKEQYSEAMQKLHAAFPLDDEASVFYALSLLGAAPPSDTELTYARKAVAILNEVLARNPGHPGAAHYLIHACDAPSLAQQGLAAARRYAAIAPSSPHALHMPAHIFARLGLWNEDIASNLAAKQAAEQTSASVEYRLHPMDFLEYAYLQTGQDAKARVIAADAVSGTSKGYGHGTEKYYYFVQAQFPALLALETRNWKAAEELRPFAGAEAGYRKITFWAQAIGAGHLRDVSAARAAVASLDDEYVAYAKSHPYQPAPPIFVHKNEAHAWLAFAQGEPGPAFDLLRAAIDYQDKVGKDETDLPAREMFADMLIESNRPAEALEQYRLSLKSDPNRFNGLFGAGSAAEALGKADDASAHYSQLLANCDQAGQPPRPELQHARQFLAARAGVLGSTRSR